MINNIVSFFGISAPRTLLATKSEKFKYRPGRMDMQLLLHPSRQMDFERELAEVSKARNGVLNKEQADFAMQLNAVEKAHRQKVNIAEREYQKSMRVLIAKYGAISTDDPIEERKATFSKALGAAAEA